MLSFQTNNGSQQNLTFDRSQKESLHRQSASDRQRGPLATTSDKHLHSIPRASGKFCTPTTTGSQILDLSEMSTVPKQATDYDFSLVGKSRRRLTSLTEEHPFDEDLDSPPSSSHVSSELKVKLDKGYHTDPCIVTIPESNQAQTRSRLCVTANELVDTSESSADIYEEDALEELLLKGTGLEQAEGVGAALSLYDRAVQQGRFEEALNVAVLESKMGVLLWKCGSYEKSLNALKRSLDVFEKHGGTRAQTMAEIYFAIGRTLASLSKRKKARKYFMKALRTLEFDQFVDNTVRAEDQQLYAKILTHVANLLVDNGSYEMASSVLNEAITLQRQILGPTHTDIAGTLLVYGALNEALYQYEYAAKCFLEALDMYRNDDSGASFANVDISVTLSNIGWMFYKTGDYESALHSYEESLEIAIPILGDGHRNVSSLRVQMGMVYAQQGNLNKALKTYRQALQDQRASLGDIHEDVALTLSLVGSVYNEKENFIKAVEFTRHALTMRQETNGPKSIVVGTTYVQLGQVYKKMGELSHASQCFSSALAIYHENTLPVTDPRVVEARQAAVDLTSGHPET